jgi:cytochrome c biogenesis protein CcmG, thiol:disulfide interchange protein DsbE
MSWRRWAIPAAGVPVVALLAWGLTQDARLVPSPLPGKPAPGFALPTLNGDTLRLSDLRGQVVLVNFWASWCIACRAEHHVLLDAAKRYAHQDVRIVGVVYQDTRENAKAWLAERGGSWPNVLDVGSQTAIQYGLFGVPETFFIGRDGRIVYKQVGPLSEAVVDRWVPRLLAARPGGGEAETGGALGSGGTPADTVAEGRSAAHVPTGGTPRLN